MTSILIFWRDIAAPFSVFSMGGMHRHLLPYSKRVLGYARRLRVCRQTPAERRLWTQLRGRKLRGLKFRRQVPLGPFIADFVCARHKVIIELDGDSHDCKGAYDQRRTLYFGLRGYRVIRYLNDELYEDLEGVLEDIVERMINKTTYKNILPPMGRETEGGEQQTKTL